MEYKSSHLINNVRLNFIMLALYDLFNKPLNEKFRIIIHPWWFDMFTLLMQTNTNVCYNINDNESCDHHNENRFEEEYKDILIDKMVQTYYLPKKYVCICGML